MPDELGQVPDDVGVEDVILIGTPGRPSNVVNRLNPDGAAMGHGACLAGRAVGWTFQRFASKYCCQGYSFRELTAQEAYGNYGVAPYAGGIVTGALTIGVCLRSVAG